MKRSIYILVLCTLASCTKVIEYKGEQVNPALYVIGNLKDTLGRENYIFVGETAFFSEGENEECDKSAEVRVRRGDGEWEKLSYNGESGYGVSLEGMEVGDTMWMEVKSKEYETGKGFAVMPPEMKIEVVEIDTLSEKDMEESDYVMYNAYAILDITCNVQGEWYFNMGIETDMKYTHPKTGWGDGRVRRDTVRVSWDSNDQLFYGDNEVEENVNIWELIFSSGEESYTHLVMKEPTVRVKVYMYIDEYEEEGYKSECLGLMFTSRVTSYDKYMYEETAKSARNAGMNPFAEPTQLWNNVKAGEKNAGIFTITSVEKVRYNRHE